MNDFVRLCLHKANQSMYEGDFVAYGFWMSRAIEYEKLQEKCEQGRNRNHKRDLML
jgi:hypothetical protein